MEPTTFADQSSDNEFTSIELEVAPAATSEFVAPSDARVLDVTDLPQELLDLHPGLQNAVAGDGIDDTAAIQAALNFSPNGFRIVYLPDGQYDVSETLTWPGSNTDAATSGNISGQRITLRGESRDGTIIKLADGVFDDENPGAVIESGALNNNGSGTTFSFFNEIRNLTVNTGDNAGATGIRSNTNNGGGVQDVLIVDGTADGSGNVGLSAGFAANIGPQLIKNVEIEGFQTGITVASNEFGATLEDITLRDQTEFGLRNAFNTVAVRNLVSEQENDINVVISPRFAGHTFIEDSTFTYTGEGVAQNSAFLFDDNFAGGQQVFLRDIAVTGYETAIDFIDFRNDGAPDPVVTDFIDEYVSEQVVTLFEDTSTESLDLAVPDTPEIPFDTDLNNWANVEDFGAVAGDGIDDTAAFQAAIDSGATTVYLPSRSLEPNADGFANRGGQYDIDGTLIVGGGVERVIGLRSQIGGDGEVLFTSGSADAVVWEGIAVNSATATGSSTMRFIVDAERDVVIASGSLAAGGTFANGPGNLFLEDVVGGPLFVNGANVYASQLDNEFLGTKVVNDGGVLVVNGMKTEQAGTVISTINGGQTEVLGALIVSSQADIRDGITPIFYIEDSDFSGSFRENQNGSFTPYSVGVREVRDGETRELTDSASFGTSAALFQARGRDADPIRTLVEGTEDPDAITVDQTGGKAFEIFGFGGDDQLVGGAEDDVIFGGDGNDEIFGGAGKDALHGGAGDDVIHASVDDASFDGGTGRDELVVQGDEGVSINLKAASIEVFRGGVGDDFVNGSGASEDLQIDGGVGNDTMIGGTGNDLIQGGVGEDVLIGRAGADVFDFVNGDGTDVVVDFDIAEDMLRIDGNAIKPGLLGEGVTVASAEGGVMLSYGSGDIVTLEGASFDDWDVSVIGQAGNVTVGQSSSKQWHRVTFDTEIENAIVIMGPIESRGNNAAVTRVRDVTDTGFEFQIDEWDYLDGWHVAETIGWMAVSAGTHELANGQTIVAGQTQVDHRQTYAAFGTELDNAIVLSEVVTVNGGAAVTTRAANVTATGFNIRLQEEEAQVPTGHAIEDVAFIAIETGVGDGIEALRSGDEVNHFVDRFEFTEDFDDAPVVIADLQTFNGGDTSALRYTSRDADSVSLFLQEEQSLNSEVAHVNEAVGILALDDGLIFA